MKTSARGAARIAATMSGPDPSWNNVVNSQWTATRSNACQVGVERGLAKTMLRAGLGWDRRPFGRDVKAPNTSRKLTRRKDEPLSRILDLVDPHLMALAGISWMRKLNRWLVTRYPAKVPGVDPANVDGLFR